jgi:hypothetical protein
MFSKESKILHSFKNAKSSHTICFGVFNYRGSKMLDIRLWRRSKTSGAFKPTSMGVRIPGSHLHDVSLALQKFEHYETD